MTIKFENVSSSTMPLAFFPLKRPESFALWESVKYRVSMNEFKAVCTFEVEIPEAWLTRKYKGKPFTSTK